MPSSSHGLRTGRAAPHRTAATSATLDSTPTPSHSTIAATSTVSSCANTSWTAQTSRGYTMAEAATPPIRARAVRWGAGALSGIVAHANRIRPPARRPEAARRPRRVFLSGDRALPPTGACLGDRAGDHLTGPPQLLPRVRGHHGEAQHAPAARHRRIRDRVGVDAALESGPPGGPGDLVLPGRHGQDRPLPGQRSSAVLG